MSKTVSIFYFYHIIANKNGVPLYGTEIRQRVGNSNVAPKGSSLSRDAMQDGFYFLGFGC